MVRDSGVCWLDSPIWATPKTSLVGCTESEDAAVVSFAMTHSRILPLATLTFALLGSCTTTRGSGIEVTRAMASDTPDAVVRVCADAAGRLYDISVQRSTGDIALDRAVLQAAKAWRSPRTDEGRPQACDNVPVRVSGTGM